MSTDGELPPNGTPQAVSEDPEDPGRALVELIAQLDDYTPTIPDAVTLHYLQKAGFNTQDARIRSRWLAVVQWLLGDYVVTFGLVTRLVRVDMIPPASEGGYDDLQLVRVDVMTSS
eukprot:Em0008g50a